MCLGIHSPRVWDFTQCSLCGLVAFTCRRLAAHAQNSKEKRNADDDNHCVLQVFTTAPTGSVATCDNVDAESKLGWLGFDVIRIARIVHLLGAAISFS